MGNIQKILKEKRKELRSIQQPNLAKIYIENGSVYFSCNGVPFSIEIVYKGATYIKSSLGFKFRVNYSNNKITIVNLFGSPVPEKLFDFEGTIDLLDCQILDYDGKYIKPTRFNNYKETEIQSQSTNFEDDTLIIRGEENGLKRSLKTGKQKGSFKFKEEKLDTEQLKTIIPSIIKLKTFKKDNKTIVRTIKTPTKKIIKKEPTIKGGKY